MPLYKRTVLPINVGRSNVKTVSDDGPACNGDDEQAAALAEQARIRAAQAATLVGSQEEAANRTLANIIRQLASLGKHANDIFGNN